MHANLLLRLITLTLCLFAFNAVAEDWQKMEVPNIVTTVIDVNGQYRDIQPGCAFSYLSDEAGLPNQSFHFYYRKGKKKDKTLIYFAGGGACWNDVTCLTSLKLGERPVYNPAIDHQENVPSYVGGILDRNHESNPVKDWNMVFIPYCTGDVHIGSRDSVYSDPFGLVNDGQSLMVQHRGFDNFMAVREWIRNNTDRKKTEDVLIAGSSAGSYGALLNFPRLRGLYPKKTRVTLLADAGTGIFTQPFVDLIFNNADGGPWGTWNTMATWIPGINQLGAYNALTFYHELVTGISEFFPDSQFAKYTSAWDSVQVLFLSIMQKMDNPLEWGDISLETWPWQEWHVRMRYTLDVMALSKNFNYYIGAGIFHAGLIDVFRPGYFYEEDSAQGVFLTDWVKRLNTDDKKSELENLICSDDCGAPIAP